MSIRTPSSTQSRQALLDLDRTNERLAQNQARISSGNRLTSPGDDPSAAASILNLGTSIQANTQSIKQADSALSFLSSSENVVNAVIDANMRLQELTVNGSAASATELDAIRANLVSLANTQSQGRFLFAGNQTLGTAAHPLPFEDATPPAGPVNYWGNSASINLNITSTTTVSNNIPGNTVFYGTGGQGSSTDIFQAITDLRNGLTTNNTALVQTAATNLQAVLANLNDVQASLGGRQSGLLTLKDTLSTFNISLQDLQNTQQQTDYPAAATQYSQDQTLQSATLSILAKTNKTNLFDYLA